MLAAFTVGALSPQWRRQDSAAMATTAFEPATLGRITLKNHRVRMALDAAF
jgi:hypothetical protein